MKQKDDILKKLYIEVTNKCNLSCRTCMRNDWQENPGEMDFSLFNKIIDEFSKISENPNIFMGGIGEPLTHNRIIDMIETAKKSGCFVELITNGILLNSEISSNLALVGLDRLWVSIDGAEPKSYSDIRLGDYLPLIIHNLKQWHSILTKHEKNNTELGISFVAMKRNISDLNKIIKLARDLGAKYFSISNVEPYTKELLNEILYENSLYGVIKEKEIRIPRIDKNHIEENILDFISNNFIQPLPHKISQPSCPFYLRKSLSIRWDGKVAPCLPLLYSHNVFLPDYERTWKEYHFNDLNKNTLTTIWTGKECSDFLQRLDEFNFAPCLSCNSCDLPIINGEDCFGNIHPACGGCLWAQGFIICP